MPQNSSSVISDCQLNVYNFKTLQGQPPMRYEALRFDPNNTCNLHCVYCHNHRSNKIIDTDALRQFLVTKILGVSFFQVGCIMEPTLDHRLADIIEMIGVSPARPAGTFLLQTNGLLLHKHDQAKMVAAGLTNLAVSLDAADPQMQRELRGGMSLKKVVRNVEDFKRAVPTVFVEFISVVTSANIGQMESLVDLALGLGVERVVFREVLYYPSNNIVDHSKMPNLILRPGEFAAMTEHIGSRFEDRIKLLFAPNNDLNASALRIAENSQRAGSSLEPLFHRKPKSREHIESFPRRF